MARADLQVENNKKNRYSESVLAGLFDPESSFNHNEAASECCVCHRNVAAADEGRKDGLCSNCRALLELGKASFMDDKVLAVCSNRISGCIAVPGYKRVLYLKIIAAKDLEKFKQHNKLAYLTVLKAELPITARISASAAAITACATQKAAGCPI